MTKEDIKIKYLKKIKEIKKHNKLIFVSLSLSKIFNTANPTDPVEPKIDTNLVINKKMLT